VFKGRKKGITVKRKFGASCGILIGKKRLSKSNTSHAKGRDNKVGGRSGADGFGRVLWGYSPVKEKRILPKGRSNKKEKENIVGLEPQPREPDGMTNLRRRIRIWGGRWGERKKTEKKRGALQDQS